VPTSKWRKVSKECRDGHLQTLNILQDSRIYCGISTRHVQEAESGVFLLDSVVSPGGEWMAPTALRATCSARQQDAVKQKFTRFWKCSSMWLSGLYLRPEEKKTSSRGRSNRVAKSESFGWNGHFHQEAMLDDGYTRCYLQLEQIPITKDSLVLGRYFKWAAYDETNRGIHSSSLQGYSNNQDSS
jgi:hypothetical protein